MSKLKTWTESELTRLKALVFSKKYTYPEISELMGKSRSQCQQRAEYMGLTNPTYRIRKTKHKHLHKQVLIYYKTHSARETQKKFNLTPSEFKSCLTYAYKIFRLIPWVQLEKHVEDANIDLEIKAAIRTMARFQRWVFASNDDANIVKAIQGLSRKH